MAAVTDKFRKYSDGSDYPNVATVSSPRATAGTTLVCDNLNGWDAGTGKDFITYQLDTADEVVPGTQTTWKGVVSGNSIINLTRVKGAADSGNAVDDVVMLVSSSSRVDDLIDGILVSHDQDGTLKAGAVDSSTVLADDVVTPSKWTNPYCFSSYMSANQTGVLDNTATVLNINSEFYDYGNDFSTSTYTYTAPVNGAYSFNGVYRNETGAAYSTRLAFRVNSTDYYCGFNSVTSGGLQGTSMVNGTLEINLTAGDTVKMLAHIDTSSTSSTISGDADGSDYVARFSGKLIHAT